MSNYRPTVSDRALGSGLLALGLLAAGLAVVPYVVPDGYTSFHAEAIAFLLGGIAVGCTGLALGLGSRVMLAISTVSLVTVAALALCAGGPSSVVAVLSVPLALFSGARLAGMFQGDK